MLKTYQFQNHVKFWNYFKEAKSLRLSNLMAKFKIKFGPRLERSKYELFKIINVSGVKNPHKL